jgi:hypothetical protein
MSEPDLTDDWMNPRTHSWGSTLPEKRGVKYVIQRERRVIVSGPSGSISRWDQWAEYDTAEDRDLALEKLRQSHPVWHLRARERNYDLERLGIYPEA